MHAERDPPATCGCFKVMHCFLRPASRQLTRAQASRRHSVLRRSLAAWALALAACRVRRLREAQARALWCRRALLRALGALAAHVAARRTKRRRLAAALNHERRRLLAAGLVALA